MKRFLMIGFWGGLSMLLSACRGVRQYPILSYSVSSGEQLSVTLINHGSLAFQFRGKKIYVDPVDVKGRVDYGTLGPCDFVFITHEHFDHLNLNTLQKVSVPMTRVYANEKSAGLIGTACNVLRNGDEVMLFDGVSVRAIPAYNTTPGREKFHPKGNGNGYVFNFDGFRVYVSGDTEPIEEMGQARGVDLAFLAVNQPYTMTPRQFCRAVKMISPKAVVPYHLGDTKHKILQDELRYASIPAEVYDVLQ